MFFFYLIFAILLTDLSRSRKCWDLEPVINQHSQVKDMKPYSMRVFVCVCERDRVHTPVTSFKICVSSILSLSTAGINHLLLHCYNSRLTSRSQWQMKLKIWSLSSHSSVWTYGQQLNLWLKVAVNCEWVMKWHFTGACRSCELSNNLIKLTVLRETPSRETV